MLSFLDNEFPMPFYCLPDCVLLHTTQCIPWSVLEGAFATEGLLRVSFYNHHYRHFVRGTHWHL